MRLNIDDEATVEAAGHVAWYAERNERVAERLGELFVSTIEQIARNPFGFPSLEYPRNRRNIRRARLGNFPLLVVYEVLNDEIDVVAIAHTSQRPGYWRHRLRK